MSETMKQMIKFRLTDEQKAQIDEYCRKHNITVSEFVRWACYKIFQKEAAAAAIDRVERDRELKQDLQELRQCYSSLLENFKAK
jgi:Arc/MetJ-type ribon-helix-helix transcriptional regulator